MHLISLRMLTCRAVLVVLTSSIWLAMGVNADKSNLKNNKEAQKSAKLPACAACRILTDSFKKGMDVTSRGKFEGGDAAWEEEKMGSYRKSEVRLIEIQEHLCKDVDRGQIQCQGNAEEHEGLLEEWWFQLQDSQPDLHKWLCIEKLEVCCPANHFGPRCSPCIGGTENPCGGNGKCKGAGTRKGSGECSCNKGYEGELCGRCGIGYYEAYRDDTKLLCEQCHKACSGPCTGAGPKSCVACREGWYMDTEQGCIDINECITKKEPCTSNEFCVNGEGNFNCIKCDKSCDGCQGDGPDMCVKCAEGYVDQKGVCVDNSAQDRERHLTFARYITYAGLTVATCIILHKNTWMAALVGLSVAVYISFSEYYLNNLDSASNTPSSPLPFTSEHQMAGSV